MEKKTNIIMSAESLSKHFGTKTALSGISVEIAEGERLAVCGGNKSGKTTLLRILCFNERADMGRIFFEGRKIYDVAAPAIAMRREELRAQLCGGDAAQNDLLVREFNDVSALLREKQKAEREMRRAYKKGLCIFRRKTAMVFSDYNLMQHLTVFQNMTEAAYRGIIELDEAENNASLLLEEFGLTAYRNVYPNFLDNEQKYKLSVLKAAVHKPRLLIIDGMPADGDRDFLREICGRCGTVVFSGSASAVNMYADRVFELPYSQN